MASPRSGGETSARWRGAGRAGLLLALAALVGWAAASLARSDAAPRSLSATERAPFEARTGVRILRVAVTGGGGLIDMRYQVLDGPKAAIVHKRQPKLIDEASGKIVGTSTGHGHGGKKPLRAGSTQYMLLGNDQGRLEPGATVTVIVGKARLEHVPVV